MLHTAFLKGTELPSITDANGGSPIGIAPYTENWYQGKRQPAGKAYGLEGVNLITNARVRRVILEDGVAKGAELVDGRNIMAQREVIVSCGALRIPQILMLSGIGPAGELSEHGIPHSILAPEVGKNFHDHIAMTQFYKVSLRIYTELMSLILLMLRRSNILRRVSLLARPSGTTQAIFLEFRQTWLQRPAPRTTP